MSSEDTLVPTLEGGPPRAQGAQVPRVPVAGSIFGPLCCLHALISVFGHWVKGEEAGHWNWALPPFLRLGHWGLLITLSVVSFLWLKPAGCKGCGGCLRINFGVKVQPCSLCVSG